MLWSIGSAKATQLDGDASATIYFGPTKPANIDGGGFGGGGFGRFGGVGGGGFRGRR